MAASWAVPACSPSQHAIVLLPYPQVAAYQSVIDLYKLRWIDFDIEGGAVAQPASIDLRNRALKRIQASFPSGPRDPSLHALCRLPAQSSLSEA